MPQTQGGIAPREMSQPGLQRRLALYAYLESLLAGKRVLEIARAAPSGTELLGSMVAQLVTLDPSDPAAIAASAANERFDIVLIPEGEPVVGRAGNVAALRRLVTDGGRLIVAVTSADRPGSRGGVGYYDLHDAFAPHFARVQMLGLTPFLGMGVVEFEGVVEGLRIDSRLVKHGAEPPTAYVAIGGATAVTGLGYALVQLPYQAPLPAGASAVEGPRATAVRSDPEGRPIERSADDDVTERRFRGRLAEAETRIAELRRKLEDSAAESESAMRVARAQGDEIEELRGRLRRAAEDRTALDAEIAKLRRALAEADESVLSLTRRTAEEMAAVAERLAGGWRGSSLGAPSSAELEAARDDVERLRVALAETEARAVAAEQQLEEVGGLARQREVALEDALERLRLADSELARARRDLIRLEQTAIGGAEDSFAPSPELESLERAVTARDDRIARLEAEKQELLWRIAELEDKLRAAIARALRAEGGRQEVAAPPADLADADPTPAEESAGPAPDASGPSRERLLEEYHRAAAAHVQEVTELKAALAEQAALVAELEESGRVAEARAATAETEMATLRRTAKDLGEADRTRRSRLAELEGKLLRLEHERQAAIAQAANGAGETSAAGATPPPPTVEALGRVEAARDELARRLEAERATWMREREMLRSELDNLRAQQSAAGASGNGHGSAEPRTAAVDDGGLLESTLGNVRQRAGRLRDDLEGIRRRLGSLTPSEIAGFLEELGDDLAELEK